MPKLIEILLLKKDVGGLCKVISEGSDIKAWSFIEVIDELKREGVNEKILESKGVILTLKQLEEHTQHYLSCIDEFPEEQVYLKRLHKGWKSLIAAWEHGSLANGSLEDEMRGKVFNELKRLLYTGDLERVKPMLKSKIDEITLQMRLEEYTAWLQSDSLKLGDERLEELNLNIEKSLWEIWVQRTSEDCPFAKNVEQNVLEILKNKYLQPKSYKGSCFSTTVFADISSNIANKVLTEAANTQEESYKALISEILEVARKSGELEANAFNPLPAYKKALLGPCLVRGENVAILPRWRSGAFKASLIGSALDDILVEILKNMRFEPDLQDRVNREAVHLLVEQLRKQFKENKLKINDDEGLMYLNNQIKTTFETAKPSKTQIEAALLMLLDKLWDCSESRGEIREEWDALRRQLSEKWYKNLENLSSRAYSTGLFAEVNRLKQTISDVQDTLRIHGFFSSSESEARLENHETLSHKL